MQAPSEGQEIFLKKIDGDLRGDGSAGSIPFPGGVFDEGRDGGGKGKNWTRLLRGAAGQGNKIRLELR